MTTAEPFESNATDPPSGEPVKGRWLRSVGTRIVSRNVARFFTFALSVTALLSGIATYAVLTQSPDALTSESGDSGAGRIYLLLNLDRCHFGDTGDCCRRIFRTVL
jgi:hypothetical protein